MINASELNDMSEFTLNNIEDLSLEYIIDELLPASAKFGAAGIKLYPGKYKLNEILWHELILKGYIIKYYNDHSVKGIYFREPIPFYKMILNNIRFFIKG